MKEELSKAARTESDLTDEHEVPETALYGIQTLRGIKSFRISKYYLCEYPLLVNALAITKMGATMASFEFGLLTEEQANATLRVCKGTLEGKHRDQFPVDMIQSGAGTTTNVSANKVTANRALELIGHKRGEYQYCSSSDYVNHSQSTSDAYPIAIHIDMYYTHLKLVKHFKEVIDASRRKAEEFAHVIKMGHTQLEDAMPMTPGQTLSGFASVLQDGIKNLNFAAQDFLTVNMGATAIGTGITAEPEYATKCIAALRKITGLDIRSADSLIGITSGASYPVGYSSAVHRIAVKMDKICDDLRLLASGLHCGLGEINLPAMQPGPSIMPGRINPVIPEVMNQIDYKMVGDNLCVAMSGEAAQMKLDAIEPVMTQRYFESADLLMNGFGTLRTLCTDGITANEEKCREDARNSVGTVTALNPVIGYKNSTRVAKEAQETSKGVYELVLERNILSKGGLDTILKPENMIHPVKLDIKSNN